MKFNHVPVVTRNKRRWLAVATIGLPSLAAGAVLYQSLALAAACGLFAGYLACALRNANVRCGFARLERSLETLNNGDYQARLPEDGKALPEAVAVRFNTLAGTLHSDADRLAAACARVTELARDVAACARDSGAHRRDNTGMLEAVVTELTGSVEEVAGSCTQASEASIEADQRTDQGKVAMTEALGSMGALSGDLGNAREAMQQLDGYVENVGGVLTVIRGIAEQTNMLALNAAIEAARAGEQGRGFAVVADEVRNLAARTQQSTREIQEMIESIQGGAHQVVSLVAEGDSQARVCEELIETACVSLAEIAGQISSIKTLSSRIDGLTSQQNEVVASLGQRLAVGDDETRARSAAADLDAIAGELETVAAGLSRGRS